MGKGQIQQCFIWWSCIYLFKRGTHTQGNRTSEDTVGSLKRDWGPTWLLAPSFTAVSPQTCPLPAFWLLVKPLHPRMFSTSVRVTKNRNVCSWHWSTERTQFFSTMMLDHALHNQHFKSWTNWHVKFCLICHIHLTSLQLSTTSSSISTIFCRENASTTSRMRRMHSTVHQILKHDFYATGINKLVSYWQNSVDHNDSYFDE